MTTSNKTILINGQKQQVSYSNNILKEEIVAEKKSNNGRKVEVTVETSINDYPKFIYTWESYYKGAGHSQAYYVDGMKFGSEKKVFEFIVNR